MSRETVPRRLLHLVSGGAKLDIVGIFPDSATCAAWKAKAQATVDNAHLRYFVVHLHRLLEPDAAGASPR